MLSLRLGRGADHRSGARELAARRAAVVAQRDEDARRAAGCSRSEWHAAKRCGAVRS